EVVSVPIIASGGAGSLEHMVQVFQETPVTGALAASIFHYGEVSIKETKEAMAQAGLEARL
ncbi:HisA/HisF-related TIM barrel protein, partial [Streptococcus sobrinus]